MKIQALLPVLLFAALPLAAQQPAPAANPAPAGNDDASITFKTSVRRVVLDVVVTDSSGNPVRGLTKDDFTVAEDGTPQKVLSFDPYGFEDAMDYTPPKLPQEPVNTFVNLPATPEKGPLYVLLYDLVNMDNEDQMEQTVNQHTDQIFGRKALMKFIENKPEGARFAIFVWSDGLHLVQGFTSDKVQLATVMDPHNSRPHLPQVYLMGENVGRGDVHATLGILNQIAGYLQGLPGRKNLIWFSGGFPVSMFASKDDGPNYTDAIKSTFNLLARDQVAIYPVDVRGVIAQDWHGIDGLQGGGEVVSQKNEGAPDGGSTVGTTAGLAAPATTLPTAGGGAGGTHSLAADSYHVIDEIARQTGGRAFYSNNDVSFELAEATQNGSSYYTLTYAPSNRTYDGRLRRLNVELDKKGYRLAYRRSYYGTDPDASPAVLQASATSAEAKRGIDDTLDVNMKHGAPTVHQLIFGAHIRAVGTPAKGTPEEMAKLTQAGSLKAGRNKGNGKTPSPIPLQKFTVDYTVMAHQLHLADPHSSMNLELAAVAYDSDGRMLNGVVNEAKDTEGKAAAQPTKALHMEQEIEVPLAATSIRIAVRDANTDRIGAMEIKLPLAPENQAVAGTNNSPDKTN